MHATLIYGQKVAGTCENINLVIVYDCSFWYYNETQSHQTPWSSGSYCLSTSYVIFPDSQDQVCFVVVAIGIGFHNPANKDDANEYAKVDRKKSLEASTLQKPIGIRGKLVDREVVISGEENVKWLFSSKMSSLLCETHTEVKIYELNRL